MLLNDFATMRILSENNPEEWFLSGFGRVVLAQERLYCRQMSSDAFGFYALQLGHAMRRLSDAPVRTYVTVGTDKQCRIAANWTALPFETESVDFVLLAHALESSAQPHAVLRESVRVLRPHGRLLIIGFNPWSLLGCRLSFMPWRSRWLSLPRVKDWLALLDMRVAQGQFAMFMPPHNSKKARRRLAWLEKAGRRWWPLGGGVYFLSAVKQTAGVHLIENLHYKLPAWRRLLARRAAPQIKANTTDGKVG